MEEIIKRYQNDKQLYDRHFRHLYFDTPEEEELYKQHYKNLIEKGELPSGEFQKSRDNAKFTKINTKND